jgi:hypothetical protein
MGPGRITSRRCSVQPPDPPHQAPGRWISPLARGLDARTAVTKSNASQTPVRGLGGVPGSVLHVIVSMLL